MARGNKGLEAAWNESYLQVSPLGRPFSRPQSPLILHPPPASTCLRLTLTQIASGPPSSRTTSTMADLQPAYPSHPTPINRKQHYTSLVGVHGGNQRARRGHHHQGDGRLSHHPHQGQGRHHHCSDSSVMHTGSTSWGVCVGGLRACACLRLGSRFGVLRGNPRA